MSRLAAPALIAKMRTLPAAQSRRPVDDLRERARTHDAKLVTVAKVFE